MVNISHLFGKIRQEKNTLMTLLPFKTVTPRKTWTKIYVSLPGTPTELLFFI